MLIDKRPRAHRSLRARHVATVKRRAAAALLMGVTGLAMAGPGRAQLVLPPAIETRSLTANAFETGTLDARDGAMAPELWVDTDPETIAFLLDQAPARPAAPAMGAALARVLLSPGRSPVTDDRAVNDRLGGKKLLALINAGFIGETRTIVSLSDAPANDPATGKALATADLATGAVDAACARGAQLEDGRNAPFWVKVRAFCYAVAGERDAADLTYGLLRDRGLLTERDERFLGGFVIGLTPTKPLQPRTALELAIARAMDQPLAAGLAAQADGAVVRAVTLNESLDATVRIHAARTALGMGIMSARDYAALLSGVALNDAERSDPARLLTQSPDNPRTEAALYQGVAAMAAPEFLRDKAALIASSLRALARPNTGFDIRFARYQLFAPEIANLEGALVPAQDAAVFARARLAVGDGAGAGRWLFAMLGEQPVTALGDTLGREFVTLTQDLAILDPATAALVADRAQIALDGPFAAPTHTTAHNTAHAEASTGTAPAIHHQVRIVEAVFDAAMTGGSRAGTGASQNKPFKTGQAALGALAMAKQKTLSPVETVVAEQALDIAGLGRLRRQWRLQTVWQERWGTGGGPAPYGTQGRAAASSPARGEPGNRGLSPRLKPRSQN